MIDSALIKEISVCLDIRQTILKKSWKSIGWKGVLFLAWQMSNLFPTLINDETIGINSLIRFSSISNSFAFRTSRFLFQFESLSFSFWYFFQSKWIFDWNIQQAPINIDYYLPVCVRKIDVYRIISSENASLRFVSKKKVENQSIWSSSIVYFSSWTRAEGLFKWNKHIMTFSWLFQIELCFYLTSALNAKTDGRTVIDWA